MFLSTCEHQLTSRRCSSLNVSFFLLCLTVFLSCFGRFLKCPQTLQNSKQPCSQHCIAQGKTSVNIGQSPEGKLYIQCCSNYSTELKSFLQTNKLRFQVSFFSFFYESEQYSITGNTSHKLFREPFIVGHRRISLYN